MAGESRIVLVTGCSQGGIGYRLCVEFASRGCIVYATARRIASMESFKHENIRKKALDVTDEEGVRRVTKEIIEEVGKIDIVVSNAGYIDVGAVLDIPLEQVNTLFNTNVYGTLRLAQAVVPHMAQRHQGLILVVGSVSGLFPTPWNGAYCASKAALNSLTDSMYMEFAPLGVQVMLVSPGSVKSELSNNNMAKFSLPENSLYQNYVRAMLARMYSSQDPKNAMPTSVFARKVVDRALQKKPPRYYSIGGSSTLFHAFLWLPRWTILWLMWRIFGKTNDKYPE